MNYRTIIRYLNNECSPGEAEQVQLWLDADAENRKIFEEIKFFWKMSANLPDANTPDSRFDARGDWERLLDNIEKENLTQTPGVKKQEIKHRQQETGRYQPFSRFPNKSNLTQIIRIAALLLVAACVGIFAWQYAGIVPVQEQEVPYREMTMEKGQRANVVLSDGTHMTLNADSRIRFPEKFGENIRELFLLEGEVYFEVAKNPNKPFLIHTHDTVVRVLGTSFAVRSYPEDEHVRVVVKEGRVQFSPASALPGEHEIENSNESVVLGAEQIGLFDLGSKRLTSGAAEDLDLYLSWTDGYLKFRETPMDEVALQLERKYNIEVEFETPDMKELQLTGELRSREVRNVLTVIKATLDIDYREAGRRKIVFMKKKKSEL